MAGAAKSRRDHIRKTFSKKKTAATAKCPKPLTCAEIRKLVAENNKSGYPDELIICQIFKETSFDPKAHVVDQYGIKHLGLMQMGQPAITDVNNYQSSQETPGATKYTMGDMTDPAKAIQAGTLYLKYLDQNDPERGTSGTLNRFGTGKGYSDSILACVKCMQENKLSCEACMKLTHPPRKVRKRKKATKHKKGGPKSTGHA